MIVQNFSAFTSKELNILKIVRGIQILISILICIGSILILKFSIEYISLTAYMKAFVFSLIGFYSFLDALFKFSKSKNTFMQSWILMFMRNKNQLYYPTNKQKKVFGEINNYLGESNQNNILIYGDPQYGKTSTVFLYLSNFIKQKEFMMKYDWINRIVYIDCKSRKEEILSYFKKYVFTKPTLIIIDNFERMGESFFIDLSEMLNHSLQTFILISDSNKKSEIVGDKIKQYNFYEQGCQYIETAKNFLATYMQLKTTEKQVLLAIYYMSMSTTLVSVEDIRKILGCDEKKLQKIINRIKRKNMIKKFPFVNDFYLIVDKMCLDKDQSKLWDTDENLYIIHQFIKHKSIYPDVAWLSFIHLTINQISDSLEKDPLFNKALLCGNYTTLLENLNTVIKYNPQKESIFFYELGTLYFFASRQKESFKYFNTMIDKTSEPKDRSKILLRIIETTHGDVSDLSVKNILNYQSELSKLGPPYSLYSTYWELHINSEKGMFDLDKYQKLLEELLQIPVTQTEDIQTEIIKRCYTDVIRIQHILFIKLNLKFTTSFLKFLDQNYEYAIRNYYESLYIKANSEHYITLQEKILVGESCEESLTIAKEQYKKSEQIEYQNIKSVSASNLKFIDLMLYENDFDFDAYKDVIENFRSNALQNNVSVHVAYCDTLLVKLIMIQLYSNKSYLVDCKKDELHLEIINKCDSSKSIYKDFKNTYGIFRVNFLTIMYSMINDFNSVNKHLKELCDLINDQTFSAREKRLCDSLKERYKKNELTPAYLISIIKVYPIIMQ